ncbi:MAG: serine dehydratase subunit alpha family protein [Denitrovibrio sp.]|nr:MAG: serine dehydratase subunit alpha family protein [Denitrovibrio sp.]
MYSVKDILKMEVTLALGCTEPVAIALAAAAAASLIDNKSKIEKIDVSIDANMYKNALAVSIPGTDGKCGVELATALGIISGDHQKRLEVLEDLTEDDLHKAEALSTQHIINIKLNREVKGIYINVTITADKNTAEAEIRMFHNNIAAMKKNGQDVAIDALCDESPDGKQDIAKMEKWLTTLELSDLMLMINDLDEEDFSFIQEGVDTNLKLADYGMKNGAGLGIGRAFERSVRSKLVNKDMGVAARILASSASDARMSGVSLPAMSSAGSGNHGLTAILPIWAVKDFIELDTPQTVLEAIALSHLVTAYIKAHTGRLSAICGCSVAAGAGAAAGITYMLGGTANHIAGAIINHTHDLAGVICDGAKAGCSLKLATAAGTAVTASLLSLQGVVVQATDGLSAASPEQSMRNIGTLASEGMVETDRTILNIMLDKQFNKNFEI